jgi:competence CoiA-like predicted nuclease
LASPKGQPEQKQRVAIYNFKNPRSELSSDKYDLTCPLCGERMSVRQGDINVPHFWHPEGCIGGEGGEGETLEHVIGKDALRHMIETSEEYRGAAIDFEYWFPDIRRRADVYVKLPDGGAEVHEIQLAKITPEELKKRTDDYFQAGVNDVHWWLGGDADNDRNRQWCRDNLGYVDLAQVQRDVQIRAKHSYEARLN